MLGLRHCGRAFSHRLTSVTMPPPVYAPDGAEMMVMVVDVTAATGHTQVPAPPGDVMFKFVSPVIPRTLTRSPGKIECAPRVTVVVVDVVVTAETLYCWMVDASW